MSFSVLLYGVWLSKNKRITYLLTYLQWLSYNMQQHKISMDIFEAHKFNWHITAVSEQATPVFIT